MKILLAEDEPVTRERLTALLAGWGYDVVSASDGAVAWEELQHEDAPILMLSDVQMPGMTGDELCRRVRAELPHRGIYIVLLTSAKITRADLVSGLLSGADDYLVKPCDSAELQARLKVGERVIGLQDELRHRVSDLEEALGQIKQLQGLLPICMFCKKVRDDQNYWHNVESYLSTRTDATFSHGICPACKDQQMESWKKIRSQSAESSPTPNPPKP
jgi:phosphoserine phosphatase RsbU/P